MNIIQRFRAGLAHSIAPKEIRARIDDPTLWPSIYGNGGISGSGKAITPDSSLTVTAVFACVKVLSETMASLPLPLYRGERDGDRKVAKTNPLNKTLNFKANPFQTAFEFREQRMAAMLLKGNHYAFKEMNAKGQVLALWPLNSDMMTPVIEHKASGVSYIKGYIYSLPNGQQIAFLPEEIWHSKDLTLDGLVGVSRIKYAANSIGIALSADEYGGRFFANDATPGGILEYPGRLAEDTRQKIVESWNEMHASSGQAKKTGILEGGVTYKQVTMNNDEAQFLETRNFQVQDIARLFRVPTILIQHPDSTQTFAAAEQFAISYVTHTVRPWAVRDEKSISVNLLTESEQDKLHVEYNLNALLRGDVKTRMESYKIGREGGWFSVNDIRRLEGANPLAEQGANEYLKPMNFEPITEDTGAEGDDVDPAAALNGAQVTAMLDIVNRVVIGEIPKSTAVEIIVNSFPVSREQAQQIVADVVEGSGKIEEPIQEPLPLDKPTEENINE